MKHRILLFAGLLLMGAPAFSQEEPIDLQVIFAQDFETDWDEWTSIPVDEITQVEYYNRANAYNGTFRPWTDPEGWQKGLFRDTLISLYNRVEVTNDAAEIQSGVYGNDYYGIFYDDSYDRRDAMSMYGETGGEGYFRYESGESNNYSGYAENYRRYMSIPGLDIEDESSYRLTFYVKANRTSDDAPSPRMWASVMRGAQNSEKPFSMGGNNSNAFEYRKDNFTGEWEKVTFMTYYLNDSIANDYFYSNGYWWTESWNWPAESNGTERDLRYIVQPDKFFVRLSFSSDYTEFLVDNISVTKSWIAGAEFYEDKMRINFGYQTNLSDLANAAKSKTGIPAVEIPSYYFEVWGLKNARWYQINMRSAEYHDDGYMYLFTEFYDDEHSYQFDDYEQVIVSFYNPVDDPELTLKYTGSLYPKALDTEWIANGKIVPDFYEEIATPNPYVFENVKSMAEMEPESDILTDWTSTNYDYYSSSYKTWSFTSDEDALLKFDWTVSRYYGDRLIMTLDGTTILDVEVDGYNYTRSGTYENYISAGWHTLKATYSKDGYSYSSSDKATVKNLQFGSIADFIAQKIAGVQEVIAEEVANNSYIDNALLAEANDYITKLEAGQYDASDYAAIMDKLDEYTTRLSYTHLDINVTVQGAMGDSILAKVENFADVQSLRLTGKLSSDDIYTLKYLLTSVIDLDLSGLDWANIPDEQFSGNSNLQYVILPANVQSIGNEAFYNCGNLKSIDFPSSLQDIGYYAFYGTSNIGDVVLPEGLMSMGENAFYYSGLTSVTFPSTLKTISEDCFNNCVNLVEINFNGQSTIDEYAFSYCYNITSLKFPATLTSIGYRAFRNCSGLSKIEFNEGLTSIGDYAFYDCDGLTDIVLPSSLQTLNGYNVFRSCDNLSQVTCKSIVPPYTNNENITGRSGLDLYVPMLSVNVYKQTSGWTQFNIHGTNIMPDNIVIQSSYKLNWPDSLTIDYKPNVAVTDVYDSYYGNYSYGSLTVNGNSTLSAGRFVLKYDANRVYSNGTYWDSEWGTYYYNRYAYSSLINNANVRADNITLEYWLRANKWEFLTVPFDVKVSDIRQEFEGIPFVIRKYDGQKRAAGLTGETWVDMTADSTLHAGEGYIWRTPYTDSNSRNYQVFYLDALQTVNKNNIFASGNVEVPLAYYESEFAHNRSWNLTGNPYPCFYDIRAMQTSAPIIVWDAYNNNYRAYSPQDDSYILNPGQAFFVQRPVDEESIVFLKEGRQTNLEVRDVEYGASHAPMRGNAAVSQRSVFNLTLSDGDKSDRTRFVFNESAQKSYEQGRDATKFQSLEPVSQLYTIEDGVNMSINERPLSDGVINLGMTIATGGTYTLMLSTSVDQEVWLIDAATGRETLLNGNVGYTFSIEAGSYDNRFKLRMGSGVLTVVDGIATGQQTESMYDMLGRPVDGTQDGIFIMDGKKVIVK